MRELWIDIETYSSISLPDCGVYKYAESEDFEILLFGYAYDDEPVRVIELALGESIPENVLKDLWNSDVIKYAHNAAFERICLSRFLNRRLPISQWRCTATIARELGLPGSLEAVGDALSFGEEEKKLKAGKALIRYFSIPCRPTVRNGQRTRNLPEHDLERWDLYVEYNRQDVETERLIGRRLQKYRIVPKEWDLYALDQAINDRGVHADLTLTKEAIILDETMKAELSAKLGNITNLDNPASVTQMKGWIQRETGETIDSLEKGTLKDLKEKLDNDLVSEALELRSALSKTSTKKYTAILDTVNKDERIRGLSMFYGASRTGRWSGRLVQMQNLPQNHLNDEDLDIARQLVRNGDLICLKALYGDVTDTLSQLIRTAFIPAEGKKFIVSDFSAIEARVLAWLAGEKWRMKVFADGGDIYCASASQMFHVPVEKHGVNAELRKKGKVAELALGYGGSVGALKAMDSSHSIDEAEMPAIVKMWRNASPMITKFWWDVDACVRTTIDTGQKQRAQKGITFRKDGPFLRVQLLNGREISYYDPMIINDQITYMGTNQKTNKWERIETYGPKLVENIVQAIARDCLAESIFRLESRNIPVVFHVHDEVICDADIGHTAEEISGIMSRPISWAPGLLLKAEAYESQYYKKD